MKLTQAEVKAVVEYNPTTGDFIRTVASGYRGRYKPGGKIGSSNGCGYLESTLLGHRVLLHRLAYLYMVGDWPEFDIDHIDGNTLNNSWSNLRHVSRRVNMQNKRRARSDNVTSGMIGCSFDKWSQKFVARIKSNGKYLNLGRFDTAEEAHSAYVAAKRRLHEGNTL